MKKFLLLVVLLILQFATFTRSFLQYLPSSPIHLPSIPLPNLDSSPPQTVNAKPLMYFTGAGVYVWWQLGVAKYIQEHYDRESILDSIAIGASAGSITSSVLLADIDFDKALKLAIALTEKYQVYERKIGFGGLVGTMLDEWLNQMLDDSIDMKNFNNLHISLTPTKVAAPKLVTNFQDKKDLINAIKASCHIPLFLDGRPFAKYRDESVIDGSFWYFMTKDRWVGLPFPEEDQKIIRNNIENILWVDYGDDDLFMKSISGNIVELITPDQMYEMLQMGYDFMKRETEKQSIPLKRQSFTRSTMTSAKKIVDTIPKELMKKIPESVDRFYRPLNPSSYFKQSTIGNAFASLTRDRLPSITDSEKENLQDTSTKKETVPKTDPSTSNEPSSFLPKFPTKLRLSF